MTTARTHRSGASPAVLFAGTLGAALLGACSPASADREPSGPVPTIEPSAPPDSLPLLVAPAGFPALAEHPDNPLTEAGVALGRRLFYDVRLSRTQSVSCATCHDPQHAFTVPEALPTRGVTGHALVRHPPSLVNLAWADAGLFWDGGSKNLESLALAPLTHVDEMGREGQLDAMMADIASAPEYPPLFVAAFGAEGVTIGNVLKALAQFQRTIVSARSRWDAKSLRTAEERLGGQVFERDCARCHSAGLFTDRGYHNNGLDAAFGEDAEGPKRGRGRVTFSMDDVGKYRTPTLRNVGRTAPYMHDGRFASLEDVVAHYRSGMVDSPSLDPGFRRTDGSLGIPMTDPEADALLSFLDLLTDDALASDARWSNPFVK